MSDSPRVYLLYHPDDLEIAKRIGTVLRSDYGVDVWLDIWEVRVGDNVIGKIEEAIQGADGGLVLLSDHELSDPLDRNIYATLIQRTFEKRKYIIPIRHGNVQRMPVLLEGLRSVPSHNEEAIYEALLRRPIDPGKPALAKHTKDTTWRPPASASEAPTEPIAIIELLLNMLEAVGKLIGHRSGKRVFIEIFQPAFDDLRKVHGDYLNMFRAMQKLVPPVHSRGQAAYVPRMLAAAEALRDMRIKFSPVRIELRQLAENLIVAKLDPTAARFGEALLEYFPDGSLRDPSQLRTANFWKSASASLLDRIAEDTAELQRHDIAQLIEDTINTHHKAWAEVCDAFQALKLETLG